MLGETLFQRTAVDLSHSYDYLFTLAVGLLFLLLPLFIRQREKADINRYSPALAWLRAFIYFSVAIIISRLSGVLNTVFDKPLYTDQQIANPTWLASTAWPGWRCVSFASMLSKLSLSTVNSSSPLAVIRSPRLLRSNRRVSNCASSCFNWWLTALWVTASSRAAPDTLECRAAASKARNALSGRFLRFMF